MCEGGLEGLVSGLGQKYPFGTNSSSLPCTTMCLGRLLRTFFGGYGTHPSSEYHRVLTTLSSLIRRSPTSDGDNFYGLQVEALPGTGTVIIPSVRVEHPQSHPVRALEQWCPDLPKVSAALKFSARCARSCKLYSIVQAAVWYKLLVPRYSCIQLYLCVATSTYAHNCKL